MKLSIRKAVVVAVIFFGCAVVVLFMPSGSSPDGGGKTGRHAPAKPENASHPDGAAGKSEVEPEEPGHEEPMFPTRSRLRPVETDLDRMRRERRRIVDQMQILERSGLGERHPSRVKVADELRKIDAGLSTIGGGTHTDP